MRSAVPREPVLSVRFAAEIVLAVILTVVVYVQTQRLADKSAEQSEELMRSSELLENQRFVRETVIGDSAVLPFSNLDLRGAKLRGLHFGCTDRQRQAVEQDADSGWSKTYVGMNCLADFSDSNLSGADLQGAQLRRAIFDGSSLYGSNLAITNLVYAHFSDVDLRFASLDYVDAANVRFESADLSRASIMNAAMAGATFIDTNLSEADLRGSNLVGASFADVTCDGTRWPKDFERPAGCAD